MPCVTELRWESSSSSSLLLLLLANLSPKKKENRLSTLDPFGPIPYTATVSSAVLLLLQPPPLSVSTSICVVHLCGEMARNNQDEDVMLSCDYLVVGAGQAGLAFVDTLLMQAPHVKV